MVESGRDNFKYKKVYKKSGGECLKKHNRAKFNLLLKFGLFVLVAVFMSGIVFAEEESGSPDIVTELEGVESNLRLVGEVLPVILIIIGGFVYGYAQMQPSTTRGKYTHIALGFVIGGIAIAAITMGAHTISTFGGKILTSS